jgi:dihydroorotase
MPRGPDPAPHKRIILKKQGNFMSTSPSLPLGLTIVRPDDWHLHLRDGPQTADVVRATADVFGRAIIMPNLRPPVTTTEGARAYRDRILGLLPADTRFLPLMTLYLTDNTSADEIARARAAGFVHAAKYYPAGATTHSDSGVTSIARAYPALAAMERHGLVLCVHGEAVAADIDIFDRERIFVERTLSAIVRDFPGLRIVLEHITTAEAVAFVAAAPAGVAATITPQHLLYSRTALFDGGIRPHYYCLPILKRENHRRALVAAATSGNPKFFLGTDSAPHARRTKEAACGCAGCYTAPLALPLYAEAFEAAGALEKLEGFASFHGADFYRLPRNAEKVTLRRQPWTVPAHYPFGDDVLVPVRAGEAVAWRVE